MSVYRRLARSKRGMGTVFGGLFFVILILMGFTAMLWTFTQFDAYNQVVTSAGIRDQQARSELLVFNPPGASGFTSNSFNITVGNQGGVTVTVVRIYITNISPTSSSQCQGANLCVVPSATTSFGNGNVQSGELNHVITVNGMSIGDAPGGGSCGSGYKVTLATSRGREFSFFCPWPVNLGGGGASNSNSTNTAHGALDVKFDLNSFNFTRGSQTRSQPGWTVPYGNNGQVNLVWWVKVVNNARYAITISKYTSLYFVCYQDRFGSGQDPGSGLAPCYETDNTFVVDNRTLNPNTLVAYDDVNRPYVLPGADPTIGPTSSTIVKFGSFCPGNNCGNPPPPQDLDFPTPYLVFMGFFYKISGQIVGQTISFVAVRACSTYPSCP